MTDENKHPMAGKCYMLKGGSVEGRIFQVIGEQRNYCKESWRECSNPSACSHYAKRHVEEGLPDEGEVLVGYTAAGGIILVHPSEVGEEISVQEAMMHMGDLDLTEWVDSMVDQFGLGILVHPDFPNDCQRYITIGMKNHGFPEIVMYANTRPEIAVVIFQGVAGQFAERGVFTGEIACEIVADGNSGLRAKLLKSFAYDESVFSRHKRYYKGEPFEVVQLLVSDLSGKFKGEPGFNEHCDCPIHEVKMN